MARHFPRTVGTTPSEIGTIPGGRSWGIVANASESATVFVLLSATDGAPVSTTNYTTRLGPTEEWEVPLEADGVMTAISTEAGTSVQVTLG